MNIRASQPTAFEKSADEQAVLAILFALSFSHLVNDTIQSLVPSVYPILKASYHLDFGQIGLITLAFQLTASFLQPVVGLVTDRRPAPFSLAVGMAFSLCGLVLLSRAPSYHVILVAAALVGVGSSIFHPEDSRIARAASGGRYGFAQSLFQVGGYWGAALGPLLAAFIVVPHGQHAIGWFAGVALVGIVTLSTIGAWYARHLSARRGVARKAVAASPLPRSPVKSFLPSRASWPMPRASPQSTASPPSCLRSASSPGSCRGSSGRDERGGRAEAQGHHHLLHAVQLAAALGLDGAGAAPDFRPDPGRGRLGAVDRWRLRRCGGRNRRVGDLGHLDRT